GRQASAEGLVFQRLCRPLRGAGRPPGSAAHRHSHQHLDTRPLARTAARQMVAHGRRHGLPVIPEHEILPYEVSPLPPGPWLVLAPHADDETIGMGGSLARAAAEGIDTRVAIMTDGALGGSQPGLVETRRQEARRACACLGVRRLHFLDEPDRGLRLNPELIEKISQLIIASGAKSVFFPGVM